MKKDSEIKSSTEAFEKALRDGKKGKGKYVLRLFVSGMVLPLLLRTRGDKAPVEHLDLVGQVQDLRHDRSRDIDHNPALLRWSV